MNRVGVYCSMILSRALSSSRSRFGSTLAAFNSLRSVPALSNVSIYKRNQQQCRSLIYVSDTRNLKELEEANEEEFEGNLNYLLLVHSLVLLYNYIFHILFHILYLQRTKPTWVLMNGQIFEKKRVNQRT